MYAVLREGQIVVLVAILNCLFLFIQIGTVKV